jgi:hypothetical protein
MLKVMRWLATATFAVALALTNGSIGYGQSSSGARVSHELDALSQLPHLAPADTSALFSAIGYRPTMSAADWSQLSNRDQLEIAWRAAEAAPQPQGERMLYAAAQFLAARYDSIALDPRFERHFGRAPPGTGPIRYGNPATRASIPVPPEVADSLDGLSRYVEGTGAFGRVDVLRRYFGLESPELERALRSRNTRNMLQTAMSLAPIPPTQEERVDTIAKDVAGHFDSAFADTATRRVLEGLGPEPRGGHPHAAAFLAAQNRAPPRAADGFAIPGSEPSGGGGIGGGGGGGGGGAPERVAAAARENAAFDARYYSEAGARSFSRVVFRVEGRGGVVLGAPVTADAALGKPLKITIDRGGASCAGANPEQVWVAVVVRTSSGLFRTGPVRCDEAYAAERMTYGVYGDMAPWRPGEAIGLTTINGQTPFFPPSGHTYEAASQFNMLLHPALMDLDIGRMVAFSDLLPSAPGALARGAGRAPEVSRWLAAMQRHDVDTWRWHEKPMVIAARGFALSAEPADHSSSVLTLLTLTEKDARNERAGHTKVGSYLPEFGPASSVLVRQVREYQRLDSLARTVAIFRWARENGADYFGHRPDLGPGRPMTPDSILVAWDGKWITGAPAAPDDVRCQDFRSNVERWKDDLEHSSLQMKSMIIRGILLCRARAQAPDAEGGEAGGQDPQ